jgi:hypothetical protein
MLSEVKTALRVKSNAFNGEIENIIAAAYADLRLVGLDTPVDLTEPTTSPLIRRGVILYAKANFGYSDESEKYQTAYNYLRSALSLSGEYKNAVD